MFGWEYILTLPYDNLVFRWLPGIDLPSLQTADDGKADNRDLVCYVHGNIYKSISWDPLNIRLSCQYI